MIDQMQLDDSVQEMDDLMRRERFIKKVDRMY